MAPDMDVAMGLDLHRHTPTLSVVDPRGLTVMAVAYVRQQASDDPEPHCDRQSHDAAGRPISQWDARFWADAAEAGVPNLSSAHSLSDRVLRSSSVDAGWRIGLFGDAGHALESWDSRGTHRRSAYDNQLRIVSLHEESSGVPETCVERFSYGDASQSATNRSGQLLRHDDTAGSLVLPSYGLPGHPLAQIQRFLLSLEMPDWPDALSGRDALLENGGADATLAYTTRWNHDALGTAQCQVDAAGNAQCMRYDVAGQLLHMTLQPTQSESVVLFRDPTYNAAGEIVSETSGHGVTTTATLSIVDGRLQTLDARRPGKVLQDLRYAYDPVGHVSHIEDAAQPTDWFAGAQVDPVSRYRYDTLYRLVEASGRESVLAAIRPGLPDLGGPGGSGEASRLRQYVQTYSYDPGGNLRTLRHASGGQALYTRTMIVDTRSNRSLAGNEADPPPDFARAFDANGNLLLLEGTRAMTWDARNQLRRVTQVIRDDGANDDEMYVYDGGGHRRRKIRSAHGQAATQVAEVRYLPGLEIRTDTVTGEVLHVATVQAGRHRIRHFCWLARHRALPAPLWRYGMNDHLGSSVLELDDHGEVIGQEGYYPYGGTAYQAARNDVEARYKTFRYSGKERDATGLYSYGFRYYAPWLFRWVSTDPAGGFDGLNLYAFVASDPIGRVDPSGRAREDAVRHWKGLAKRATRPVQVRSITPGIVAVTVSGNASLLDSLGLSGLSPSPGPRTLDYLAIDPRKYQGIVSGGGGALVNPMDAQPGLFASYSGAHERTMAHINAGFYNIGFTASADLPEHASIGPAVSNLLRLPHVRIPTEYAAHYRNIELAAGTYLHAAPALTSNSSIVFHPAPRDPLFLYEGGDVMTPGRLHHAEHPNARSGISLPSSRNGGLVRIAVGSATGRGPGSIGYTLRDWALVMQRLDRLDDNAAEGIEVPHDSTNLDGGSSSMMGVIDAAGRRLHGVSQRPEGRLVSTSITFRQVAPAVTASSSPKRTRSGGCCSIV